MIVHGQRRYHLKPGNLYLIPAYTSCDYACNDNMKLFYIHVMERSGGAFTGRKDLDFEAKGLPADHLLCKRLLQIHSGKSLIHVNPDQYSEYEKGLTSADRRVDNKLNVETRGILLQLLSRFISDKKTGRDDSILHNNRLTKVVDYIHRHATEKITVSKLAGIACLNTEYFSKWFIASTGVKPMDYINRRKVQESQRLLLSTKDSLETIALNTGFYNHSHMIKLFRKYVKVTPAKYRENNAGMQGVVY